MMIERASFRPGVALGFVLVDYGRPCLILDIFLGIENRKWMRREEEEDRKTLDIYL